jgi:hypothetical protein
MREQQGGHRETGQGPLMTDDGDDAGSLVIHHAEMSRTELIIQVLKLVLGLALGAYFVWWSLEVLNRLPPYFD